MAIGTVFRHFPTKDDLLAASMKRLLAQLVEEAGKQDLFAFFRHLVAQAAGAVADSVRLPDRARLSARPP